MVREGLRNIPEGPEREAIMKAGSGEPADVANPALFLASDESRQITGTTMVIDNGATVG